VLDIREISISLTKDYADFPVNNREVFFLSNTLEYKEKVSPLYAVWSQQINLHLFGVR
jgi:hypothetical protein